MKLLVLLGIFAITGCSDTSGGNHSGGGKTTRDAAEEQEGDAVETDVRGSNDSDSDNSDGGDNASEVAAADPDHPSDDEVCAFMKANSLYKIVKDQYAYLCEKGGLKLLRKNPGKIKVTKDKNANVSELELVGMAKVESTVEKMVKIGEAFCADFQNYKDLMGADLFEDVESIETSNAEGTSCDYTFKAKKILIAQAKFKGKNRAITNKEGNIAYSSQYLTQKISGGLVHDSVVLNVLIKNGDHVEAYNVTYSASETMGFHGTVKDKMLQAFDKGLKRMPDVAKKL
jgi:hypothetical protein